ncbi:AmmeMemoRadiSam system radical SAM enzyme [Candidatus Harpocratesius sp.]
MKKIAELWESFGNPHDKQVKCNVCSHYCIIKPNNRGFCRTRVNLDGTLYSLDYGALISPGTNDPVEKKPLYHFFPGSQAFSIATIGCNFKCKQCQNWEISQSYPSDDGKMALFSQKDQHDFGIHSFLLTERTPDQVISQVKRIKSTSIAYTYNEPTIWFEFIKDTSILAHKEGIKNILVSNGYSSPEANSELINFIDAANIDIKSMEDSFYKRVVGVPSVQPVLDTCKFFKENNVHLEITNLLIPGENDSPSVIRALIKWVLENLDRDTPLHFSAYTPRYRMNHPSTSKNILKFAWKEAKSAGLHYVYMGNVYTTKGNNTYCSKCGELIISRQGYNVTAPGLSSENTCLKCGEKIPIVGNYIKSSRFSFF